MAKQKTKLELTWIGKENRPKLERWSERLNQRRSVQPLFCIRWTIV